MNDTATRVNWWQVIVDLGKANLSLADIAAATGIPKSTLDQYKNRNSEPKHADGERLLSLWRTTVLPKVPTVQGSVRNRERSTG